MAAQSFHFIEPESGLRKVARCLAPGGSAAIFGNHPQIASGEARDRVQLAYERLAPELSESRGDEPLEDWIDGTGLFGTVLMARYPWQATYSAADYVGLIGTYSDHRLLPPGPRAELFEAIQAVIENAGGTISIDYVTRLHLARRR